MRRTLASVLALGLLAALPAAAAATEHVPLRATLTACSSGPDRADRRAAFRAAMPDRPGAAVLAVRFALERRTPRGWRRVAARTFDRWERSDAGAPGFVFTKQVAGLWSPGRFRARVRFSWRDAAGRVVATATRRTRSCRQRDHRPDLRPLGVAVTRDAAGAPRYVVRVVNEGRGTLEDAADVALRVGGAAPVRAPLGRLARGEVADLVLDGRPCAPGEPLRATADPGRDVRERGERDNVLVVACPG